MYVDVKQDCKDQFLDGCSFSCFHFIVLQYSDNENDNYTLINKN